MEQCAYVTSQCSRWAQNTLLDFPYMDWLILVYCSLLIVEQLEQFIGRRRRGRGSSYAYVINCFINCPTSSQVFSYSWRLLQFGVFKCGVLCRTNKINCSLSIAGYFHSDSVQKLSHKYNDNIIFQILSCHALWWIYQWFMVCRGQTEMFLDKNIKHNCWTFSWLR